LDSVVRKSAAVGELVRALEEHLGERAFVVVDHWEADLRTIGVASVRDPRLLVYVSVNDAAPRYFVSFEFPPAGEWTDHPYTPGEERSVDTLSEVIALVKKHITSHAA
jgi:hypothetical protein